MVREERKSTTSDEDSPAILSDPTPFYIDLEWKIIYVGSASSETHDQVLDTVLVGPIPVGRHKFVFQVREGEGHGTLNGIKWQKSQLCLIVLCKKYNQSS